MTYIVSGWALDSNHSLVLLERYRWDAYLHFTGLWRQSKVARAVVFQSR